jgi:hypothetical protein
LDYETEVEQAFQECPMLQVGETGNTERYTWYMDFILQKKQENSNRMYDIGKEKRNCIQRRNLYSILFETKSLAV